METFQAQTTRSSLIHKLRNQRFSTLSCKDKKLKLEYKASVHNLK